MDKGSYLIEGKIINQRKRDRDSRHRTGHKRTQDDHDDVSINSL